MAGKRGLDPLILVVAILLLCRFRGLIRYDGKTFAKRESKIKDYFA